LSERFETPLIGLQLAGEVQPATFGVLGFLTQACATFGDVLNMITRFNGLLSNFGHTSLRHTPGEVHIQWDCRAGGDTFRRHATDYVLGSFVVLGRALLYGKSGIPGHVNLAHPAPRNSALLVHYHALFRCPVYFDQPVSELVLPVQYLSVHLRHSDALVREALERHAEELLRKHDRSNLTEDVRELIAAMLTDTPPGKEVVARQLGMSSRSLHRALQKAGSSYQQLLDEARIVRARELLASTGMAVEEVALKVGFQSRQSFIRWFKDETGTTPGDYRRSHTRTDTTHNDD
jgi:AraC-like DNA-binding protein